MILNEAVLARAGDPNALFVFLHCQRTGGSNMQRWLRKVFGNSGVYSSQLVPDFVHWQKQKDDLAPLGGYRVFAGFSQYVRREAASRPLIFMTNVRHPFYRAVSIYGMSRHHTTHFLHHLAIANDFENFYRKACETRPEYFHDLCAERIAGVPDADAAIEAIERDFGLVATTNRLHEATAALVTTLGWRARPIPASEAPADEFAYARWNDSPVREEIEARNPADMALYAYVTANDPAPEAGLEKPWCPPSEEDAELGLIRLARIQQVCPIANDSRVIDYNCQLNSLGAAIVESIAPRHYLGLDEGLPGGEALLAPELVRSKAPRIIPITDHSVAVARGFSADVVIAMDILYRTAPDRVGGLLADLASLAGKSGARLVFNAWTNETGVKEIKTRCWSWPRDELAARLRDLGMELVEAGSMVEEAGERRAAGQEILVFVRRGEDAAR